MSKEPDYEVTEGNIFEALGREQSEELLARAKLLTQLAPYLARRTERNPRDTRFSTKPR